jgi:hypothetical protein
MFFEAHSYVPSPRVCSNLRESFLHLNDDDEIGLEGRLGDASHILAPRTSASLYCLLIHVVQIVQIFFKYAIPMR